MRAVRRSLLAGLCAAVALGCPATAAEAPGDPLFVFVPVPPAPAPAPPLTPPPTGYFNGPCGLAVDASARFYVSDYHHHAVDVFNPPQSPFDKRPEFLAQLPDVDPVDGPCGLAVDGAGSLYVNAYHRNVAKYGPFSSFAAGPVFDSGHPTGVAVNPVSGQVYVNNRSHISVYASSGAPVLDGGGQPLRIGLGTLGDGYGLAVSQFAGTFGRLYVPDAATDTVKVYDPAIDTVNPVATVKDPLGQAFTSLRDSAIAVDRVSGDVYFADNTQPAHTERPQSQIYVYGADGAYEGRLKYKIVDALPPGLAVDNSTGASQGRVYVTSGNTHQAGIYAYPPGAAIATPPLPPKFSLALATGGTGDGLIVASLGGIECSHACEEEMRAGAVVSLTAMPGPGSDFAGWSGGGCAGRGRCAVEMSEARSVRAEFSASIGPPAPDGKGPLAHASETVARGNLQVTVDGKLSPRRLPRTGTAPIAVSIGGEVSTTDASLPPQLEKMRIELNRHGRLDYTGLPTCVYDRIQPASSARALASCRSALVGRGSFSAIISLAGQEPYPTGGRLLVFNGLRRGKPVLYGHIYAARPFASSFVLVFAIEKLGGGTYGTALSATPPKAFKRWGNLIGLQMTLSRRYSYRGSRRSYVSAGCPAPKGFSEAFFPLARTSFAFAGAKKLTTVLISSCRVKR